MEVSRAVLDSTESQVNTVSRTVSPPPTPSSDTTSPPIVAEYWCHTQVRVTKMKYIWTISNFSFCREEMGEVVKSSFFSCGLNDKLKWCLRINPKGLDEESREYLSLYLLLVNCGTKGEVRAKFKFSLLNAKREETKAMESQRAYRFVQGKDWGFKKFIRRDVLFEEANGLLPNDRLTILCEVSVVGETVSESGQVNNSPIQIPNCNLNGDIGSLLSSRLLTDVTLIVLAKPDQDSIAGGSSLTGGDCWKTNSPLLVVDQFNRRTPPLIGQELASIGRIGDEDDNMSECASSEFDDDEDEEATNHNPEGDEEEVGAVLEQEEDEDVTQPRQSSIGHQLDEEQEEDAVSGSRQSADLLACDSAVIKSHRGDSSEAAIQQQYNDSTSHQRQQEQPCPSSSLPWHHYGSNNGIQLQQSDPVGSSTSSATPCSRTSRSRRDRIASSTNCSSSSSTPSASSVTRILRSRPRQHTATLTPCGFTPSSTTTTTVDRSLQQLSTDHHKLDASPSSTRMAPRDDRSTLIPVATTPNNNTASSPPQLNESSSPTVLRRFEAHKAILAARSPVFAAMFEHGMEESRANRVEINDLDPETMAQVLKFIYTDKVDELERLGHELLAAADKYQLERLKIMCEESLADSLTVENACYLLGLADLHNAEQLKVHAMNFVVMNAHDVTITDGYKQLVRHQSHLLHECFQAIASQQLPMRCWARKRPRQS